MHIQELLRNHLKAVLPRFPQESDSHIPSLLLYATVCIALGRQDGAVQSLLRLIVLAPKHKAVRRTLAGVLGSPEGLAVLEDQLPFTTESAPALAFLANILKVCATCVGVECLACRC